jgi:hypothetical protein
LQSQKISVDKKFANSSPGYILGHYAPFILSLFIPKQSVAFMKWTILFLLTTLSAWPQTTNNFNGPAAVISGQNSTNLLPAAPSAEQVRTDCINKRRSVCGRIIKILPDGIIVHSGYANLLREPFLLSWLVPATVNVTLADHLIEGDTPGTLCVGLVFLTDLPKGRGKPEVNDYVILEGYPCGNFNYNSVGDVKHVIRRFSNNLDKAVKINLAASEK